MAKNSWAISRINGKAFPWKKKKNKQIITSVTCRLLWIKIRFLKDRYFHSYVKHAFNKVTSSTAPHWKLPVFKKLWDDSFACNCLPVLLSISSWNESETNWQCFQKRCHTFWLLLDKQMCQRTLLEKIYVGYKNLSFHGAVFKFKPVSPLMCRKVLFLERSVKCQAHYTLHFLGWLAIFATQVSSLEDQNTSDCQLTFELYCK